MNFRGAFGWLLILLLAAPASKAASTLDKIDQARAEGRLSADQAILLKVQTLKNGNALPEEYRPDRAMPERCGSRVILEALQNRASYSPITQAALNSILQRFNQHKTYKSPDGIFLIHYDTAGLNVVPLEDQDNSGAPDYVENLALYADSSYRMEVLQMGYRRPPFDADSLYDIYTQEIPYYGYTEYEGPSSFIVVHNNFFNFPPNNDPDGYQKGAMKVTIAHELHHAIQFAYSVNFNAHVWFMEATSTWMEDVVFDPVDDNYQYLPSFFNEPYIPLTNTDIHMYACFIWDQYLAQNFNRNIIRQVWEQNVSTNSVQSLNLVLQGYGSSLGKEFSRFALWNFYTGSRNDGQHYEEGSFYPLMTLHINAGGPMISGRSRSMPALAAAYEAFPSNNTIEKARLTFAGRSSGVWGAQVVLSAPPVIRAYPFNLVSNITGDTTFFGVDSFPRVVLVAAQIRTGQPSFLEYFDYTYKAFPFYIAGDLNEDLLVNAQDIVFQMNLVFLGILPPENHLEAADLNCDETLAPADLVLLLNLVFRGLPFPCPPAATVLN